MKSCDKYLSSDKKNMIAYSVYTPESNPIAVLQISHGMCEHMERYEDFAKFLNSKGIIVCGNDHLGHGASVQSAENYGFFGENNGIDYLVDDLEALRTILKKRYRSLPYFMLGHSMGSFLARLYMVKYPQNLDGVILSGTNGESRSLRLGLFVSGVLSKLRGARYRSAWLKGLVEKPHNERYKSENDSASCLSKDESIRKAFHDDQRCNFIFTVRAYHDLFTIMEKISDEGWAQSVPKGLPVLMISGDGDPIGDYGNGARALYARLEDAELHDLTLKLYPNGRHEMLNETERETVYADVYDWIIRVRDGVLECRMQNPRFGI